MVVFPVKTDKENAAVSPLFGKAKYFAFFDGVSLNVEKNPFDHGSEIIGWFKEKGVKEVIIKEMGINPYRKIQSSNIKIYYAGDDRITSDELVENYKNGKLEVLDDSRMQDIIKQHENSHTHGDHSHDHDHHHDHGDHHHHH